MIAEILQQYEPAMLKIVKIVLERNTEISACCCQEALARMRTCFLTRYGTPGVGYGIYLVSNYPMKIQESTWWYDKMSNHSYVSLLPMSQYLQILRLKKIFILKLVTDWKTQCGMCFCFYFCFVLFFLFFPLSRSIQFDWSQKRNLIFGWNSYKTKIN